MTLTEQIRILDDKIKANKAQYDLDKEAAKTSALSSGELEKYEYLTSDNLGYKPDVVQKSLNILHSVKFLIKGWMKVIKKKNF